MTAATGRMAPAWQVGVVGDRPRVALSVAAQAPADRIPQISVGNLKVAVLLEDTLGGDLIWVVVRHAQLALALRANWLAILVDEHVCALPQCVRHLKCLSLAHIIGTTTGSCVVA